MRQATEIAVIFLMLYGKHVAAGGRYWTCGGENGRAIASIDDQNGARIMTILKNEREKMLARLSRALIVGAPAALLLAGCSQADKEEAATVAEEVEEAAEEAADHVAEAAEEASEEAEEAAEEAYDETAEAAEEAYDEAEEAVEEAVEEAEDEH